MENKVKVHKINVYLKDGEVLECGAYAECAHDIMSNISSGNEGKGFGWVCFLVENQNVSLSQ